MKFVFLMAMVVSEVALAAPTERRCVLPAGLSEEVSRKYPGTTLTGLSDLDEHDRALFQKDHGHRCPGLISVNFYGDGSETWALALVTHDGTKTAAKLVLAHKRDRAWDCKTLDTADAAAPVLWREAPGKYRDVYGEKTIQAPHQAIVFAEYENWAILYAWTGKQVEKIWISD